MSGYLVYGLFTLAAHDGEKRYFYVGKTRRTVALRVREHIYRSKNADEHVYAYLRQLEDTAIAWESEVLRDCGGDQYVQDAERFEVIRLLRLGHDLCNMRYGDTAHKAELARQTDDPAIRSAADVTLARLTHERHVESTKRAKKRSRLRRKELANLLKEGIPSVRECFLLSPATRRRLTTNGDMSVEAGYKLSDLVRHARDYRKWDKLHEWAKALNAPSAM